MHHSENWTEQRFNPSDLLITFCCHLQINPFGLLWRKKKEKEEGFVDDGDGHGGDSDEGGGGGNGNGSGGDGDDEDDDGNDNDNDNDNKCDGGGDFAALWFPTQLSDTVLWLQSAPVEARRLCEFILSSHQVAKLSISRSRQETT